MALLDPHRGGADALHLLDGMAHKQHGYVAGIYEALDAALALLLEKHVAHRERLVDDEDVGLHHGGDGERDTRHHTRGVVLHGHVEEVAQLGEVHNLVKVFFHELLGVTQKRTVEEDVLTRGELEVETSAQLNEGRDVTTNCHGALRGLEHAGNDLEHGGFTGTVGSHQADDLALLNLEAHVLQSMELLEKQLVAHELDEVLLEGVELLAGHVEDHRDVVDLDGVLGVSSVCHGAALDVEDELVLGLLEHEDTDDERDDGPRDAHEEHRGRGVLLPQENVTHKLEVVVHGVYLHQHDDPVRGALVDKQGEVPEDGREVGPRDDDDTPQVDDVAEEDGERTDGHAHADAEEHQQEQAQGQPDEVPRGHNLEEQHDNGHGDERESEVHEREQDLLHREDVPVDLNLLEQGRGVDDARERRVGRVAHERERDIAHDEVEREVGDVAAKHVREHDGHDDHHEQRVENAPQHTEETTAVLKLEVLGDELLEDEQVLLIRTRGLFGCKSL